MGGMTIKEIGKCQMCLEKDAEYNFIRESFFRSINILVCKECCLKQSKKFNYCE